jgi:hypothetical protein
MKDIVERLRKEGENPKMRLKTGTDMFLMTEAADEIERLRNGTIFKEQAGICTRLRTEIGALRAEVAMLRDALIRMRDSTHTSAAVLRGMADFELQKAALGGED